MAPINSALRELKREPNEDERRIQNERPTLDPAALLCLEAWHKLDSQRPPIALATGQVFAGAIPRLAVKQWADWEGIDADLAIVIADVIHEQDLKRARRISSELELKGRRPKR